MGRFNDQVIIITGAGGGFGRVMSCKMAAEGGKIVVADWNETTGKETVDIIKAKGNEAVFVKVDVTSDESVKAMVDFVVEKYGKIDVLVNNAGKQGLCDDIIHMEPDYFQQFIDVNVRGVWMCIHHAGRELIKSKGKIVNIASIAATKGSYGGSAYGVSKGAVLSLTYAVANELGLYGVRCNAVSPYSAVTEEALKNWGPEFLECRKSGNPLHKLVDSEDVANAVMFLASDESNSCTGLNLLCDCGATVQSCPFLMDDYLRRNDYSDLGVKPWA